MLRGLFLALLVVAGPVQAQVAQFCDVMEQVVETCCCSDEAAGVRHDAEDRAGDASRPCCRALLRLVVEEAAAAAIPPAGKPAVSADAHDPPLLAPPRGAVLSTADPGIVGVTASPRAAVAGGGARTYLHTLRLRL